MDRLAAMETFICAVETGSFSAAAKLLRVGQPAVSKTIAALEESLGTRLLLRTTRGLTPTEAGQTYYDAARRTLDQANEADAAVRGVGSGFTGRLRISAATTFASLHVIPYLGPLLKQHPELNVEVILDDRRRLLAHGRAGRLIDDGQENRPGTSPDHRYACLFPMLRRS
jgi:DNA-binding transcriptional LysR family regulator